ncbi:MAG: tetratricopeptide repeat protein [Bacillota bacterium]
MINLKSFAISLVFLALFCSVNNTNFVYANAIAPTFDTVVTTDGKYPVTEFETATVGQDRADYLARANAHNSFAKSLSSYQPVIEKLLTEQQLVVLSETLTSSAIVAHSTKKFDAVNYYYIKSLNTLDLSNFAHAISLVLEPQIGTLVNDVNAALSNNFTEISELQAQYAKAKTKLDQQAIKNKISANETNFETLNFTLQSFTAYANADYDNGKINASKAIEYSPNYADAYFMRGLNLIATKNSTDAMIDFTSAIEKDPTFVDAYNNRGMLYIEANDPEKAIADFTMCISLRPDLVNAYIQRGTLYYKQNKKDLALADFNQALTIDSKNAQTYLKRGNIYFDKGAFDLALIDFEKATDLGISDASVLLVIGNINFDQKKFPEAITAYYKYLAISRNDITVYVKLGNCFDQLKQYDTAIVEYTNALAFDKTVQMYSLRANDYFLLAASNKTFYDSTISDCSAIIALDAVNADAYLLRGRSYKALLNQDPAIADFSKVIELNPENAKLAAAFNFRAWCYVAKGGNSNNVHATQDFLKALIVDPANPNYDYSLAQFYDSIKQATPDTINAYKAFLKKAAANPEYKDKVEAAKKRIVELGGQL